MSCNMNNEFLGGDWKGLSLGKEEPLYLGKKWIVIPTRECEKAWRMYGKIAC